MGPGGETKEGQIRESHSSIPCWEGTRNTAELTNSSHSRTLIVDIFAADVTHHLGGHSLKGEMQS